MMGKALESVFKFLIYILLEEEISTFSSILAGKIHEQRSVVGYSLRSPKSDPTEHTSL